MVFVLRSLLSVLEFQQENFKAPTKKVFKMPSKQHGSTLNNKEKASSVLGLLHCCISALGYEKRAVSSVQLQWAAPNHPSCSSTRHLQAKWKTVLHHRSSVSLQKYIQSPSSIDALFHSIHRLLTPNRSVGLLIMIVLQGNMRPVARRFARMAWLLPFGIALKEQCEVESLCSYEIEVKIILWY